MPFSNVLKAAKYGSLMGVGIVSGATAWKKFKNAAKVRQRFVAGSKTFAVPTEQLASQLFLANPEVKTSFMVYDRAAEGLPEKTSGSCSITPFWCLPARPARHAVTRRL